MNNFISKYGYILGACALVVADITANFCAFVFHQPEIPESVKKMRKVTVNSQIQANRKQKR